MEDRQFIERSIIGSLLLYKESYPIFRILRPKNFLVTEYREIYGTMLNMIPHTPIDIITISDRMQYLKGKSYLNEVINTTLYVSSHEHSIYWAFLLLEHDVRDKIIKALIPKKDIDIVLVVIKHISDRKNDMFKAIADSIDLFEQENLPMYVDLMKTVYAGIDKKVLEMKRDAIVKHTEKFLSAIKNYNPFKIAS